MEYEATYYKTSKGEYIPEHEVEKAFYLATGKDPHSRKSARLYKEWLTSITGKSIISEHKESEIKINAKLYKKQKLLCIQLYYRRNKCSLREARDTIEAMFEKECAA